MSENEQAPLLQEEYIHSLENALIFMCQTYQENHDALLQLLRKDGNEAFWQFATIQGSPNVFAVDSLSKLSFQKPAHGFQQILKEIQRKRQSK